jgi:spore maturation protein CgeB
MKLAYFTHSLESCWNHGNAHFLRGVLRELKHAGHTVNVFEPSDSWSRSNLIAAHGEAGLDAFRREYPELRARCYEPDDDPAELVGDSDVVVAHEWNEPALIAALGRLRRRAGFRLLFHDTHHRAVSGPDAIRRFDLSDYDGVLAFGEALAEVYRRWSWGERVFVWHEAADIRLFRPPAAEGKRLGLAWIGNWGDEERTAELETFLLAPAAAARLPLDVYGVRYPQAALDMLARCGATYRGWLANADVPRVFAAHLATMHVPRRFYATRLPGIPTIRVFEALACGIPLVCAPWRDEEGLFRPGEDYLVAETSEEMRNHLLALESDPDLRRSLSKSGLSTIRARHTCAHRARELIDIVHRLRGTRDLETAA